MAKLHQFLALDLGAESGRGIIVSLEGGCARLEEIHRFANTPVEEGSSLSWDFEHLLAEVVEAISRCVRRGIAVESISVDTWGVDFGLLDASGELVGRPGHYRDKRTENIHEYSEPFMSSDDIFAATAYEPWAISSLFQLLSMQRGGSEQLGAAAAFLNMPDLFNYHLTCVRACELSVVNTSNLLGKDLRWSEEVIRRFSLPRELFGDLVSPGTILGPLTADMRRRTGMAENVPVIATCGHDTSAAVAAVPGSEGDWAFISCGTWSILGALVDEPIATQRCRQLGFTNEYSIGTWYLGRNISGLWLIQELRRKWSAAGDDEELWTYERMTAGAARAEQAAMFDAADASLLAPDDMEEALRKLIAGAGQDARGPWAWLVRSALESLALEYNRRLAGVDELTGRRSETLFMVGGGTANTLLCQLTADACGVEVLAGAAECTALGNGLAQAMALGVLSGPADIRRVVRDSVELAVYSPRNQAQWADKRRRYAEICQ